MSSAFPVLCISGARWFRPPYDFDCGVPIRQYIAFNAYCLFEQKRHIILTNVYESMFQCICIPMTQEWLPNI